MPNPIRQRAATEAGIEPDQAEAAVTSVLRSLHRLALTDAKGLTAVALAMRYAMGPEACYHLFGLLELERQRADHEIPWSEVLDRIDPHMRVYGSVRLRWIEEKNAQEPPL